MLLTEIMNTKVDYTWDHEDGDELVYFTVNNIKYRVCFAKGYDERRVSYHISFGNIDSEDTNRYTTVNYNLTKTGNEFKIYSIVIDIIQQFVKKFDPDVLSMTIKEPNRMRLYYALINRFGKNYELKIEKGWGDVEFYMHRKKEQTNATQ